jgi:hypothetical protein
MHLDQSLARAARRLSALKAHRGAMWRVLSESRLLRLGLIAMLVAAPGCDACSREPKVPFKLGQEQDAEGGPDAAAQSAESKHFEAAVDQPVIDGKLVPIDFVRALLAHDLDGDGDRDVLAIMHDTAKRLRLTVSMREPDGFGGAEDVAGFAAPGDDTCSLSSAELRALAGDKAVASIALACGDPQVAIPPSLTFLSLEAPPRVYERIALLGAASSSPIAIAPGSQDVDGDGHSDIVLHVSPAAAPAQQADGGGVEPGATLMLTWLDRPGGLSRDLREPDATLGAWASAAQALLAKKPEQAQAQAARVVTLESALCREGGRPVLQVAGAAGIACKPSKGVTGAFATLVLAHARLKQLAEAFDAYGELARREPKPEKKQLERVLTALAGLPKQKGIAMREGPRVEPERGPRMRLPAARFVDESTLLLRRSAPVLYSLEGGQETGLDVPTDDLLRDPSGELFVTDIERTNCGLRLRIERAPKPGSPFFGSAPVATPTLLAFAPDCQPDGGAARPDAAGFQLLGWAPQGVVAARGRELRVVPLSAAGAPSGEPFVIEGDTPLPAPLPSGLSAPDGSFRAELTPAGVLVYARGAAAPELWRPDGFAGIAQNAREVAISPQGRRAAVVADGIVYVLSREP